MKLVEAYIAVLKGMGIKPDSNNYLHVCFEGEPKVDNAKTLLKVRSRKTGKDAPLILPTDEVLRLEEDGSLVKFHPMTESFMAHAPSEVVNRLVLASTARTFTSMVSLMGGLTAFAIDSSRHDTADPALFDLIQGLPIPKRESGAKKLQKYINSIVNNSINARGKSLMGTYKLDRLVEFEGKTWSRACRFNPTIARELGKEDIFGVKAPNKDAREFAQKLIERIVIETAEQSVAVTDERDAPYFMVLLESISKVGAKLNKVALLLGLSQDEIVNIDLAWTGLVKDLPKLGKTLKVPFDCNVGPLDGDVAFDPDVIQPEEVEEPKVAPAPVQAAAPVAKVEPVVVDDDEDEEEEEVIVNRNVAQMANAGNEYTSPYARKKNTVTKRASAPVTVDVEPSTGNVVQVERTAAPAPTVQPAGGMVQVERADTRQQLTDAYGKPLFLMNGQPWLVAAKDVPKMKFVQKVDTMNRPMFDQSTGTPMLVEVSANAAPAMGGYPAAPAGNPNDPMAQWRANNAMQAHQQLVQQSPGWGAPQQAPAPGWGVPQQQPQMQTGWGQPAPQQAPAPGWGVPQQQPQMQGGWGQPQPQMQGGWGQPQMPQNTVQVANGASFH